MCYIMMRHQSTVSFFSEVSAAATQNDWDSSVVNEQCDNPVLSLVHDAIFHGQRVQQIVQLGLRPLKNISGGISAKNNIRAPLLVTQAPIFGTIGTTVPLRHNYPTTPQIDCALNSSEKGKSFGCQKCSC